MVANIPPRWPDRVFSTVPLSSPAERVRAALAEDHREGCAAGPRNPHPASLPGPSARGKKERARWNQLFSYIRGIAEFDSKTCLYFPRRPVDLRPAPAPAPLSSPNHPISGRAGGRRGRGGAKDGRRGAVQLCIRGVCNHRRRDGGARGGAGGAKGARTPPRACAAAQWGEGQLCV